MDRRHSFNRSLTPNGLFKKKFPCLLYFQMQCLPFKKNLLSCLTQRKIYNSTDVKMLSTPAQLYFIISMTQKKNQKISIHALSQLHQSEQLLVIDSIDISSQFLDYQIIKKICLTATNKNTNEQVVVLMEALTLLLLSTSIK